MKVEVQICNCGQHGRLLFDGLSGMECMSKQGLEAVLLNHYYSDHISEDETRKAQAEIDKLDITIMVSDEPNNDISATIKEWNSKRYGNSVEGKDDTPFQNIDVLYKLIHG